jgi:hypothetical protein
MTKVDLKLLKSYFAALVRPFGRDSGLLALTSMPWMRLAEQCERVLVTFRYLGCLRLFSNGAVNGDSNGLP